MIRKRISLIIGLMFAVCCAQFAIPLTARAAGWADGRIGGQENGSGVISQYVLRNAPEGRTTLYLGYIDNDSLWDADTTGTGLYAHKGSMTGRTLHGGDSLAWMSAALPSGSIPEYYKANGDVYGGMDYSQDVVITGGNPGPYTMTLSVRQVNAVDRNVSNAGAHWKLVGINALKNGSGYAMTRVQFRLEYNEFNICYHIEGEDDPAPDTYTYSTSQQNVNLRSAARDGYTFSGWYRASDYSGEPVDKLVIAAGQTGDIDLYGRYTVSTHTHTYGDPVWDWAADYKSAAATFTCTACDEKTGGHSLTIEGSIAESITGTCDKGRTKVYTATVEHPDTGEELTDTKTEQLSAAGEHTYRDTDPVWSWSDDHRSATATFTCINCLIPETITATVSDPEFTSLLQLKYVAAVNFDGQVYTDEVVVSPMSTYSSGDTKPDQEPETGQDDEVKDPQDQTGDNNDNINDPQDQTKDNSDDVLKIKTITAKKTINRKKNKTFVIKVKLNKEVKGKLVKVKLDNIKYKAKTNENGLATIRINLKNLNKAMNGKGKKKFGYWVIFGKSKIKRSVLVKTT